MNPSHISRSLAAIGLLLIAPRCALADQLQTGARSHGVVTSIQKGVKEFGTDALFVTSYDKSSGASNFALTLLAGLTFRYFVIDNVALSLDAGGFYDTRGSGDAPSAFGGFGTLSASYYVPVGGGLMLAPTLGGGGFYGGASQGAEPTVIHSKEAGGIGRAGLGFVFYTSSRFNLFARPEAVAFFGSSTPEATAATPNPTGSSLTRVTGGFSVGLGWVF